MGPYQLQVGPHTVDGRNPAPVEVGSLSHYLQWFYASQVVSRISEPSTVPPFITVKQLQANPCFFRPKKSAPKNPWPVGPLESDPPPTTWTEKSW